MSGEGDVPDFYCRISFEGNWQQTVECKRGSSVEMGELDWRGYETTAVDI